jgi:hypothetical protein
MTTTEPAVPRVAPTMPVYMSRADAVLLLQALAHFEEHLDAEGSVADCADVRHWMDRLRGVAREVR